MGSTGLYVHVPFCVRKCNYCDFCSVGIGCGDDELTERMVDCLIRELNDPGLTGNRFVLDHRNISTVFIGGGTPSILPAKQVERLLSAIRDRIGTYGSDAGDGGSISDGPTEFTIECNPGTVDEDKLRLYKEYGVNRLSFGLQSANDDELKTLGRIHTYDEFVGSYKLARSVGFDNINIDVITAVPGQTKRSLNRTLEEVIKLEPEHVSAYSLIIEEGTPFFEKYRDVPPTDEETDRAFFEMTHEMLTGAGYVHYEISNYAKKRCITNDGSVSESDENGFKNINKKNSYACLHNLNYWNRGNYIGIGPAASSHMNGVRKTNTNDLNEYIKSVETGAAPVEEIEELSVDQQITEAIYLGLRTAYGIAFDELSQEFGKDIKSLILCGSKNKTIEKMIEAGFMDVRDDRLTLTPKGWWISDSIVSELIEEI